MAPPPLSLMVALLLLFLRGGVVVETAVPLAKMQEARVLLEHWDFWTKGPGAFHWRSQTSSYSRPQEGETCSTPANHTLALLYFLRVRDSHSNHKTYTSAATAQKEFYWMRHVGNHLRFYKAKMGGDLFPLPSHDTLCARPKGMTFPSPVQQKLGFLWPPKPYYLMCEANKCVPCDKVVSEVLKEACNLKEPVLDSVEVPTEAQKLFDKVKSSLLPLDPKKFVGVEGESCNAFPEHTLWVTLFSELFSLREKLYQVPRTLHQYQAEWKAIEKIDKDVLKYLELFENVDKTVWGDRKYCDPAKGLVCGGLSCKLCTEAPPKGGVEVWRYEQGHLHSACTHLMTLGQRSPPMKDQCPEPIPCPPPPSAPPCPRLSGQQGGPSGRSGSSEESDLAMYRRTHQFNRRTI